MIYDFTMIFKVGQCSSFPCQNGGSCVPTSNYASFTCTCPTGFYGTNCQNSILFFIISIIFQSIQIKKIIYYVFKLILVFYFRVNMAVLVSKMAQTTVAYVSRLLLEVTAKYITQHVSIIYLLFIIDHFKNFMY